jgi:4-hydroxythreonine-4-phosphate dehydrogenase
VDVPFYPVKSLVITPGEPAGIGPDIVVQLAAAQPDLALTVVADQNLLAERAKQLGMQLPKNLFIQHIPLAAPCRAGVLNPDNAGYVLDCLTQAATACMHKQYHALVTGPVHKGVINQAGISFSGHTEFLAKLTGSPLPVMLLVAESMRVALLTTHLPLAAVPAAVTKEKIVAVVRIIMRDLQHRFQLSQPRLAVCGLNPHAGENGYLGREDLDIIIPAIAQLREEKYWINGPLPADTAFTPDALQQCDAVLTMYHDQGLPVIKAQHFSSAVNVTLGLPIIRTSVDHGTALALAGTGKAEFSSLSAAIALARQLA